MSEVGLAHLPRIGMDFSMKVTADSGPDHHHDHHNRYHGRHQLNDSSCNESQTDVASATSDTSAIDHQQQQYPCPACPVVLSSPHELTNHLRGHNSPRSNNCTTSEGSVGANSGPEDGGSSCADYVCGVCHKQLSSASSLDRHVLVDSGERPFKCKHCDMAFTTNGNMNRHIRTAHHHHHHHHHHRRHNRHNLSNRSMSPSNNSCTDSEASDDYSDLMTLRRQQQQQQRQNFGLGAAEYNNNEINLKLTTTTTKKRERDEDERDEDDDNNRDREDDCEDDPDTHTEAQRRRKLNISSYNGDYRNHNLNYDCELCGKRDFASAEMLEAHRLAVHATSQQSSATTAAQLLSSRNSVIGFNDLTYTDFTSGKFPTIARIECEKRLHRPASGELARFQCSKCTRAFPCQSALDAHEIDCGQMLSTSPALPMSSMSSKSANDFFAGLDLQNKAALAEAKEGKDLADIQSIISMTSRSSAIALQNISQQRSDAATPDNCPVRQPAFGSSGSSGTASEYHEEEAQDDFAAEFRKMKLKGEFPCRLCPSVFPNLRALKGHNRNHVNVSQGMPFPCNICTYTAVDKVSLMKHLKSHNGARPYECSLCNYAFTTKANCERHVRNRHGKLSREEIKGVLIYHPSEDSANDPPLEANCSPATRTTPSLVACRDEVRKTLVYPSEREEQQQQHIRVKDENQLRQQQQQHMTYGHHYDKLEAAFPRPAALTYAGREDKQLQQRSLSNENNNNNNNNEDDLDSRDSSDGSVSLVSETKPDQRNPIDLKRPSNVETANKEIIINSQTTNDAQSEDAPLDLTMDVLDLSKKAAAAAAAAREAKEAEDLSAATAKRQEEIYNAQKQQQQQHQQQQQQHMLLTQAYMKAQQQQQTPSTANLLESFYANAPMPYQSAFAAAFPNAGLLQPFGLFGQQLFGHPELALSAPLYKELVRGLRTSGGSLVEGPTASSLLAATPKPPLPASIPNGEVSPSSATASRTSAMLSSSKPIQPRDKAATASSSAASSTSSSAKLVMKNGMLMPKQKQRRYRTERPFSCEHCAAKFTLRSNMERHVKQQHPQHWCQKPRGAHSTRGRPPANPPTLLQSLRQPSGRQRVFQPYPVQTLPQPQPQQQQQQQASLEQQSGRHAISEQVKFAILAQQLKANNNNNNNNKLENDPAELVIDESEKSDKITTTTTSLLRGKLEAGMELEGERKTKREREDEDQESSAGEEEEEEGNEEDDEDEDEEDEMDEGCRMECDDNDEGRAIIDPLTIVKTELQVVGNNEQQQQPSKGVHQAVAAGKQEEVDLASVSEILDRASRNYQQFHSRYISDEDGLLGSVSDCCNGQSGSDEKSDSVNSANSLQAAPPVFKKKKMKKKKKKSAYSLAPNRVICPYCQRPFPWTSSLRRHILTHTGQKPYHCPYCTLLFTTKSNCDRHLLRKHKKQAAAAGLMRAASCSSPEPQAETQTSEQQIVPETNTYIATAEPEQPMEVVGGKQEEQQQEENEQQQSSNAEQVKVETNSVNNGQFSMRNVPERPFKCNKCPSSTFSTLGNLRKHKSTKHPRNNSSSATNSGSESPSGNSSSSGSSSCNEQPQHSPRGTAEDQSVTEAAAAQSKTSNSSSNNNDQSGYESQSSGISEGAEPIKQIATSSPLNNNNNNNNNNNESGAPKKTSPRSSPGPPTSETPFKCHMCDSGFSERQDCLDHLRVYHEEAYERLMSRGALEKDYDGNDPSDVEETTRRVRVTDYNNRKVICVFCMRRFWSAEDLRRHMRTHTGERPYTCDICAQRFTLKHSMLRHRKKHDSPDSAMYVGTSGDEDSSACANAAITPRSRQPSSASSRNNQHQHQHRMSLPQVASVATGDAAPSGLVRPFENGLATLTGKLVAAAATDSDGNDNSSDLISNLLGIGDNIIDRALQSSVDDAAKLLGIKESQE